MHRGVHPSPPCRFGAHVARASLRYQVVTLLLEANADRNIRNSTKQTPYELSKDPATGRCVQNLCPSTVHFSSSRPRHRIHFPLFVHRLLKARSQATNDDYGDSDEDEG
jgi:ankyrin repeat protein